MKCLDTNAVIAPLAAGRGGLRGPACECKNGVRREASVAHPESGHRCADSEYSLHCHFMAIGSLPENFLRAGEAGIRESWS